jgi:NADH-quinone oxidoreductase subunit F
MERPLTQHIRASEEPLDLPAYTREGGYEAVRQALIHMSPEAVTEAVKAANLRGRGGAGFPTGVKWSFVPMGETAPRPKYLIANADEMEPGTFKDRLLLEGNPHQLIEGMIVSAYAIQADVAYIFLRWAYKRAARLLTQAIAEAYRAGYLGRHILGTDYSLELQLHVSAGRYMCGEETGLLNALEGKRATPRAKPPFPQVSGLWGKPTIVNNVETLCNVPHIITQGADWYKALSRVGTVAPRSTGSVAKSSGQGRGNCPWGPRYANFSKSTLAACARDCGSAACCQVAPRPIFWSRSISTCPCRSMPSKALAVAWAPAP